MNKRCGILQFWNQPDCAEEVRYGYLPQAEFPSPSRTLDRPLCRTLWMADLMDEK